jgi:hypothetical protein
MIKIKKINLLSEEANEAEVHLFDGNFNIICFSHLSNRILENDNVPSLLYTLNVKTIYNLNNIEMFLTEKEGTGFEYKFSGRVIDKEKNQIRVGEFIIQLDIPLPNDIHLGYYISFSCDRVDIY